ncbi:hypothetical protein CEXT_375591 [Caerostris extrusa]|uniref:Uncharacterized protein n=1 Tax=Caerostris extrusa TaxID=172846 RepID=A0AAV4U383_CAEEX|nr:hypothetical protein CEXT_375591 [Caerostris extrusa]
MQKYDFSNYPKALHSYLETKYSMQNLPHSEAKAERDAPSVGGCCICGPVTSSLHANAAATRNWECFQQCGGAWEIAPDSNVPQAL